MPPPRRAGMNLPTWLLTLLFAVGFLAVGGGLYWLFGRSAQTSAVLEAPAPSAGAKDNPVQKYIEVTGMRFASMSKGVQATFVLVNHSDSDIVGLTGTATVMAKTQKAGEEPIGTVDFQTSMAAQTSKELTLPLTTKLKMVDMPDWQNVTVTVHITSPPGA
jgi:hypothetical protein